MQATEAGPRPAGVAILASPALDDATGFLQARFAKQEELNASLPESVRALIANARARLRAIAAKDLRYDEADLDSLSLLLDQPGELARILTMALAARTDEEFAKRLYQISFMRWYRGGFGAVIRDLDLPFDPSQIRTRTRMEDGRDEFLRETRLYRAARAWTLRNGTGFTRGLASARRALQVEPLTTADAVKLYADVPAVAVLGEQDVFIPFEHARSRLRHIFNPRMHALASIPSGSHESVLSPTSLYYVGQTLTSLMKGRDQTCGVTMTAADATVTLPSASPLRRDTL